MPNIDPVLYTTNNSLQRNDALYVLEKYVKLLNFTNKDFILDVGTGDGAVLHELILPRILSDLEHIVALDINNDMLKLAKKRLSSRPNVEFVCVPIETPLIPFRLCKKFDHIFSFYCLHFVMEPRCAYENLLAMLKDGGDMLLTIVANHPVFDVHEAMAKMKTWQPFMLDVFDFITPYQHSTRPDKEIEKLLENLGFVNYKCDLVDRTYTHKDDLDFWEWATGVNPFIKRIPQNHRTAYKNDYLNVIRALPDFKIEDKKSDKGQITVSYRMLVVYAAAPSNNSDKYNENYKYCVLRCSPSTIRPTPPTTLYKDALYVLEEYFYFLNSANENILDVGTGDGVNKEMLILDKKSLSKHSNMKWYAY